MKTKYEKGQSLVFVTIVLFGLFAMAALIVDGGSLYLNRREVQTAVDAAALAGAYVKCVEKGTFSEIEAAVMQYAITENGATTIDSITAEPDGSVLVRASLSSPSFFAGLLGFDANIAQAEAAAGCFSPKTMVNLLPIAWSCRAPIGSSVEQCTLQTIPWKIFKTIQSTFNFDTNLLDEGDEINYSSYYDAAPGDGKLIYLVIDSDKFDPLVDCQELNPAGTINCDFDNDGLLNVDGGANRGWLLLDGTGASDLTDIMLNGYPDPITLPHWFPGKSGVSNSVFINAHSIRFNVAMIPVYNAICDNTTANDLPGNCPTEYQVGDLVTGDSGNKTYYRVAAFAPFVITCVSKGNSEYCPGKALSNVKSNTSTIEGYFVNGFVEGDDIDPGGFDLGVYIISLVR